MDNEKAEEHIDNALERYQERAKGYIEDFENAREFPVEIDQYVDTVVDCLDMAAGGHFGDFLGTRSEMTEAFSRIQEEIGAYFGEIRRKVEPFEVEFKSPGIPKRHQLASLYNDIEGLCDLEPGRVMTRKEMRDEVSEMIPEDTKRVVRYATYKSYGLSSDLVDPQFDEVPIEGNVRVVGDASAYHSDDRSIDFKSEIMESPTWRELVPVANRMILETGDHHHCFLEQIHRIGTVYTDEYPEEGVKYCEFIMGS